jgi:hypothetical protein
MSGAVARDGEPVPTSGPSPGSVKKPIEYSGYLTPIRDKAHGIDWLGRTAVAMTLDGVAQNLDKLVPSVRFELYFRACWGRRNRL